MLKGDLENKKVLGNQKKFALLELIYGIDYETAENYVNKYGTDIETLQRLPDHRHRPRLRKHQDRQHGHTHRHH